MKRIPGDFTLSDYDTTTLNVFPRAAIEDNVIIEKAICSLSTNVRFYHDAKPAITTPGGVGRVWLCGLGKFFRRSGVEDWRLGVTARDTSSASRGL